MPIETHWSVLASSSEASSVTLGGEHGLVSFHGCCLVDGSAAALYVTIAGGARVALGRVTEAKPYCPITGRLYETAQFSVIGDGKVQLAGRCMKPDLGGEPSAKRQKTCQAGCCPKAGKCEIFQAAKVEEIKPASAKVDEIKDAPKTEENKTAEAKAAETKTPEPKTEQVKIAEAKVSETKVVNTEAPEVKTAPAKPEVKVAAAKPVEVKAADNKAKAQAQTAAAKPAAPAAQKPAAKAEAKAKAEPQKPKVVTLNGGLKYEVVKEGSGSNAMPGRNVQVRYDGRLAKNGRRFDKGVIKFRLGAGEVIDGWDTGVKGMRRGEQRRLMIPSRMGYGSRGAPPDIPANADLIFDVELLQC